MPFVNRPTTATITDSIITAKHHRCCCRRRCLLLLLCLRRHLCPHHHRSHSRSTTTAATTTTATAVITTSITSIVADILRRSNTPTFAAAVGLFFSGVNHEATNRVAGIACLATCVTVVPFPVCNSIRCTAMFTTSFCLNRNARNTR
jgi:hypothetical protein